MVELLFFFFIILSSSFSIPFLFLISTLLEIDYLWIFFNQLCAWFFINYLCNRWDVYQTSISRLCDFIFSYICDLRATTLFGVWPSSTIMSVILIRLPSMSVRRLIWVTISGIRLLACDDNKLSSFMVHRVGDYRFLYLNMKPYSKLNSNMCGGQFHNLMS